MNDIGVIFDCDGTLVDSMGAWHEVDRTLAAEAGITLKIIDGKTGEVALVKDTDYKLIAADGIHLTMPGYEQLFDTLADWVKKNI